MFVERRSWSILDSGDGPICARKCARKVRKSCETICLLICLLTRENQEKKKNLQLRTSEY